ncbi:hypothetical protein DEU56DRAFT_73998 [Suillus clintonianus]|uniref:uncharacterized protein n=1 Tax=Suillus clintonianus TaxID=1904413 RepID=UPI001B8709AD|nr:uncharacterized protein DEU56DRAFT_73998 [Suillus clintonianus]KAG2122488.1 hypothetical protein DEU56DRAFT_73998 [Suillus clintonianus]
MGLQKLVHQKVLCLPLVWFVCHVSHTRPPEHRDIKGFCSIRTIAITIPRVPILSFNSSTPLVAATGNYHASIPTEFSRYPADFSFPLYAGIQVDTTANIIPLSFDYASVGLGMVYFGKDTLRAKSSKYPCPT